MCRRSTIDELRFDDGRGGRLAGTFTRAGGDSVVVFVHGFLSDRRSKGRFPRLASALASRAVSSLAFDFSGCGESADAVVTFEAWESDLRAAVDFARAQGYRRVALLGHSLGGLVCLRARVPRLEKLVLTGSPTDAMRYDWEAYWSAGQMAEWRATGRITVTGDSGLRARMVVDGRMLEEIGAGAQRALVADVRCPVLMVTGDADGEEQAILEQARRALPLLPAGSRLVVVEGVGHGFGDRYDRVVDAVVDWLVPRAGP